MVTVSNLESYSRSSSTILLLANGSNPTKQKNKIILWACVIEMQGYDTHAAIVSWTLLLGIKFGLIIILLLLSMTEIIPDHVGLYLP